MKIFLLSEGIKSIREDGKTLYKVVDEKNKFKENLIGSLEKCQNFLFICNNPKWHESCEKSAKMIFDALKEAGMPFESYSVLDGTNWQSAAKLVNEADLIYLQGGKLKVQLKFFAKIGLKGLLEKSHAVVAGVSAGAMNLGEIGYNYPERRIEVLLNKKYLNGLGFHEFIVIPHFTQDSGNLYCPKNINLLKKYYLPDSQKQTFLALPNGSYVFIDDNKRTLYGEAYKIEKGQVIKICDDEEMLDLTKNAGD